MNLPALLAIAALIVNLTNIQFCTTTAISSIRQPAFAETAESPIGVGPMAGEPAIGDCNNDGNLDIVIACGTCCGSKPDPESGHVVVLLGDGRGNFARAKGSPIKIASSARKVALGDINNDKRLDILVAQHDSYDIVVLTGDGKGGFVPAPSSPIAASRGGRPHTHDIVTGDVNGDGNLDFLTTNANDNNVSVMLGDGKGNFAHAIGSPVAAGRHPYDVVLLHDLNADGKLDLITPNMVRNEVTVMLGDGKGCFAVSQGSPFALGPRPGYIAIADLNGDGKPDMVAAHDDDPLVAVLIGDGKGGFQPSQSSPLRTEKAVWGTALGDINGDGINDIVTASMSGNHTLVMLGDGKGGFAPAAKSHLRSGTWTNYVALADLDKDGKPDIIASNYGSGDVNIFLNTTK